MVMSISHLTNPASVGSQSFEIRSDATNRVTLATAAGVALATFQSVAGVFTIDPSSSGGNQFKEDFFVLNTNAEDSRTLEVGRWTGEHSAPADGDYVYHSFWMDDEADVSSEIVQVRYVYADTLNTLDDSRIEFWCLRAGTLTHIMEVDGEGSFPAVRLKDNVKSSYGDDANGGIWFDGTDLCCDPRQVGSGSFKLVTGNVNFADTFGVGFNIAGTTRYGLMEDSDVIVLANRGVNGVVEIRASNVSGGSGGEQTLIRVEDDSVWVGRGGATDKLSFHNVTPVVQQSHISDPSGGGTVDSECRTAVNSILSVLESYGFTATS